jgi:hypothetical protein
MTMAKTNQTETWKQVPGKLWFVSDLGRVREADGTLGTQKDYNTRGKYLFFKNYRVHCAVLEAFVGPCPPGKECRHLDGNGQNNKLQNLKWGTRLENVQDSIKHGTNYCLRSPSEETRKRIGAASRERNHTEETRRKISISLKGRKMSEETKLKMPEAVRRGWETRRKNSKPDSTA